MSSGVVTTYSATLIAGFGFTGPISALLNTPGGIVSIFFTLLVGFGIRKTSHRWAWNVLCTIPGIIGGGLLSFPIAGYTLALDLPAGPGVPALVAELDRLTLAHGGRIYLAKDALADAATFARMYPQLTAFKAIRRDLDPRGVLASRLAHRLELL